MKRTKQSQNETDWPIRIEHVQKAMRMVESPREWLNCLALEKQLAMALELYEDRGEFDGTIETAVECLERAAYEIQSDWRHYVSK